MAHRFCGSSLNTVRIWWIIQDSWNFRWWQSKLDSSEWFVYMWNIVLTHNLFWLTATFSFAYNINRSTNRLSSWVNWASHSLEFWSSSVSSWSRVSTLTQTYCGCISRNWMFLWCLFIIEPFAGFSDKILSAFYQKIVSISLVIIIIISGFMIHHLKTILNRVAQPSAPASAGGTDRDLAGTQFPRNCVPYNIIEF